MAGRRTLPAGGNRRYREANDSSRGAFHAHGGGFLRLRPVMQNITLGESGQVFSPYYRDQFSAWYNGKSFPMLFSDAAVERGAAHKLVLEPSR